MKGKKLVSIFICSILIVSSVLIGTGLAASSAKKYTCGIDGDYPPYSFIGENGKPTGFDVESLQWIAKEMGFEVDIRPIAWDGIIPALMARKIDMVYSGMTASPERRRVVDFSKVYWVIDQAVCIREDSDLNMITALTGKYRVGVQRGTTAAMWIEDNLIKPGILPKDKLKLYDNFPLAVRDLLNGRVEAAMMDDVIVDKAIEGKPLKRIGSLSTSEEYAVAVRKGDDELKAIINEGLDRLMNSSKWSELKLKYKMGK